MTRPFIATLCTIAATGAAFAVWTNRVAQAPAATDAALDLPAKSLTVPTNACVAVFAGGCFWGTEETFRALPGVLQTQTGYMGGTFPNPTYRTAHARGSGYVEAVKIVYDPAKVRYETLLQHFFDNHDPTAPRPGSPVGTAYRSFVFAADADQAKAVRTVIASLNKSARFAFPIATQVRAATVFYPAEVRHQLYYAKRDGVIQCQP